MTEDPLFDVVPRSELEQALDTRMTGCPFGDLDLSIGELIVASRSCGGYPIPLLQRLAGGEGTAVEQWAAEVILRGLGRDLAVAHSEKLMAELRDLDEGQGE